MRWGCGWGSDHALGHRGLTHSLPFSLVQAGAGSLFAPELGAAPSIAFFVLLVSATSHGLLDAMTNGGLGIAFFSPFSNRCDFLPWRVIEVLPLSIFEVFSWRGVAWRGLRAGLGGALRVDSLCDFRAGGFCRAGLVRADLNAVQHQCHRAKTGRYE